MNKREALVTLIKNSFMFTDQTKKTLLLEVSKMTDVQVEALGRLLAAERQFVLENAEAISQNADQVAQYVNTQLSSETPAK